MSTWFTQLCDEAHSQSVEYRTRRVAQPEAFGNAPDGSMDGTAPTGPLPAICWAPDQKQGWLLWHIHKWPWPLQYHYCFGKAWDSKGERTDPFLAIDVRDLPKQYHGRLKIDAKTRWRKNHRIIIGRALADGYDLAAHAVHVIEAEQQAALVTAAEREQRRANKLCVWCGNAPATADDECEICSEIPF